MGLKPVISKFGFALGIASTLAAVVAGMGNGYGWWDYRNAIAALPFVAYGGIAAIGVSLIGFAWPRRRARRKGVAYALIGLLLGLVAVGYPYTMRTIGRSVPPIHDITTDTENPPAFVATLPLRQAAGAVSPPGYDGPEVAKQQLAAYPAVRPARFAAPPAPVFDAALATAKDMGWQIVAAVPAEGRIEAIATTFWFHFRDDIVIRIAPEGSATRLDIRSKSRVGRSDLGTNARRIVKYLAALEARMAGR